MRILEWCGSIMLTVTQRRPGDEGDEVVEEAGVAGSVGEEVEGDEDMVG